MKLSRGLTIIFMIATIVLSILSYQQYKEIKSFQEKMGEDYISVVRYLKINLAEEVNYEEILKQRDDIIKLLLRAKYQLISIRGIAGSILVNTIQELEYSLVFLQEDTEASLANYMKKKELLDTLLTTLQADLGDNPVRWYRELNNQKGGGIGVKLMEIYNSSL